MNEIQPELDSTSNDSVTSQIDSIESEARQMGWRPKAEFDGAPEEWVDAKEYVGRKPLYDRLKEQSKHIRRVEHDMKVVASGIAEIREQEFNRALATLKAQRKEAMAAGDDNAVEAIDEQAQQVKAAKQQVAETLRSDLTERQQRVAEWEKSTDWYKSDRELRADAQEAFETYIKANPDFDVEEALKYVERRVKRLNPDKFQTSERTEKRSAPTVEGNRSPSGGKQNSKGYHDLPEGAKAACDVLVRRGIMTRDDYLKNVKWNEL